MLQYGVFDQRKTSKFNEIYMTHNLIWDSVYLAQT